VGRPLAKPQRLQPLRNIFPRMCKSCLAIPYTAPVSTPKANRLSSSNIVRAMPPSPLSKKCCHALNPSTST
jgi:hypothetical protein